MTARHNSRDLACRSPFGARPAGDFVTLRLFLSDAGARVTLRVWWEGRQTRTPMAREDGAHWVRIRLPDKPGLFWYYFIIESGGRTLMYGNAPDALGGEGMLYGGEPPSFQITVYDPAFTAPRWMEGGLIYQIMVDRFCASRPAATRPPLARGRYHDAWHEPPELLVDPETGDNRADDFFGGDLQGISDQLPYLSGLGVTVLYLNPIFSAPSNHKYDTADYETIDPSFGTNDDFRALCARARTYGIRVLLDGVFSHTGSDSRYFNRLGRFGEVGAYQSQASPYFGWYRFSHWPDEYDCWWGFKSLPNVDELNDGYLDYMIRDQDAIAARWLRAGASGWRLDVADELPMAFMRLLRARVKSESPESALIGEVWDDASNKVAYGALRSYCLGDSLDGVMNYPLRDGLLAFMTGALSAHTLKRRLDALNENYPPPFQSGLMNLLGSHDKPRAINVLSGAEAGSVPRGARRAYTLTDAQYALGARRFAAAWQFVCALPGMPCLYYGDEVGAQGGDDPFCRAPYPWGREDRSLLRKIRDINRMRRDTPVIRTGACRLIAWDDALAALRFGPDGAWALCALNRSDARVRISIAPDDAPELGLARPVEFWVAPQSAGFKTGGASA